MMMTIMTTMLQESEVKFFCEGEIIQYSYYENDTIDDHDDNDDNVTGVGDQVFL